MITLDGKPAHSCVLDAHETGCWTADVQCDADQMSGKVSLDLDGVLFIGTVTKTMKDHAWLHVEIQGGAGWTQELQPKSYAVNDAGTKAQGVIEDLARTVGETLGSVQLDTPRLGSHYVRPAGKASLALTDCLRGTNWWVDHQGVTQIGARPERTLNAGFDLRAYDRETNQASVTVDRADSILCGDIISHEMLPEGFKVKSLTLQWDESVYLRVTLRGDDDMDTLSLIERIVERKLSQNLYGIYEYRVVSQSGQKLNLQATRRKVLPDLASVPMFPAVPGAKYQLPTGMRVLCCFINADRTRPVVIAFVDETDGAFKPTLVTLSSALNVEGEITARASSPLERVGLCTHWHKSPTGPTDPPQGGT
ncbi:MAG: hypothetical protein ACOYBP_08945 [Microbacteriaceae bacterium]